MRINFINDIGYSCIEVFGIFNISFTPFGIFMYRSSLKHYILWSCFVVVCIFLNGRFCKQYGNKFLLILEFHFL